MPQRFDGDRRLVRRRFSGAASEYDFHARHQRLIAGDLLDMIRNIPCTRILELGCGTGLLSAGLRSLHPEAELVLTDSAPGMVSVCRTRVHPSSLVRHSLFDFEESRPEEEYDLVVSSCALQWLRKPESFGERLYAMVQPGGITVHAIPVKGMFSEFKGSFLLTGNRWPSLNYLSGRAWNRIMVEAGFRVTKSCTRDYVLRYASPLNALRDLKGIGASLAGHSGTPELKPSNLRKALELYASCYGDGEGSVPVTYRIHFLAACRD